MQSPFNEWLTELSEIAEKENKVIEAKYYDGLDYFFKSKMTPFEAYPRYLDLVRRIMAIRANPM